MTDEAWHTWFATDEAEQQFQDFISNIATNDSWTSDYIVSEAILVQSILQRLILIWRDVVIPSHVHISHNEFGFRATVVFYPTWVFHVKMCVPCVCFDGFFYFHAYHYEGMS
jgi:hypothetical protein